MPRCFKTVNGNFDLKDLEEFLNLPSEFNAVGLAEIKSALQEFFDYRAYVVDLIEMHGGDFGFKKPDTYFDVECEIKWRKLPPEPERKLLAVLAQMRLQNCKE